MTKSDAHLTSSSTASNIGSKAACRNKKDKPSAPVLITIGRMPFQTTTTNNKTNKTKSDMVKFARFMSVGKNKSKQSAYFDTSLLSPDKTLQLYQFM